MGSRAMAMKGSKPLLIFSFLYFFCQQCLAQDSTSEKGLAQEDDENFSGHKLFQTRPKNDKDRELLDTMDQFYPEDVVDFWRDPNEDTVEFLVHGDAAEDL